MDILSSDCRPRKFRLLPLVTCDSEYTLVLLPATGMFDFSTEFPRPVHVVVLLAGIGSLALDRVGQCHRSTAEADLQRSVLHEEIPSLSLNQQWQNPRGVVRFTGPLTKETSGIRLAAIGYLFFNKSEATIKAELIGSNDRPETVAAE